MKILYQLCVAFLFVIAFSVSAQELAVPYDLKGVTLTPESFENIARLSFAKRRWEVESASGSEVIGRLMRKGYTYKVHMKLQGNQVMIGFVPGHGMQKANYLRNLALDFETELGKACLRKHGDKTI